MPIYEYRCMGCDTEFEHLVFGSDCSVTCPECNTEKVKRQMSSCSFKSSEGSYSQPSGTSAGCASCSSGNCSTCH